MASGLTVLVSMYGVRLSERKLRTHIAQADEDAARFLVTGVVGLGHLRERDGGWLRELLDELSSHQSPGER